MASIETPDIPGEDGGQEIVAPAKGRIGVCLLVTAVALFVANAVRFAAFTADDAFITLRYARNLAAGYGPTFNPGWERAEGYTGLLWMLLMALPHWLGLDAALFAKATGVLATMGTLGLTARLARQWGAPALQQHAPLVAGLAALWLAVSPWTAVHAVSGMETALYTLLLTALFCSSIECVDHPTTRRFVQAAVVALLCGLTRPEGNLAAVVAMAALLALVPRWRRLPLAWAVVLSYLIPGAVYLLWRVAYYGHLLPLPFYIKVTNARTLAGVGPVLGFVRRLLFSVSGLPLIAGLCTLRRHSMPTALAALCVLAFFVLPEHIMGYCERFLYPLMPLCVAVSASGLAGLIGRPELGTGRSGGLLAQRLLMATGLLIALGFVQGTSDVY